jgi:hypothetical protein
MDSILANGTWDLTERPYGCKPVGCKWVFKKKLRADGTIEKYKARLVAKGYTQKEGEDFFDTYSPVARLTTIRVLLSLAASHGLLVHQMDIKTAFLNGELDEEIYMEQPDGFVLQGQERKVCKLKKSLYGLKQAPKQWHEKFERTLTSVGFVVNEADKCVYYRHGGGEGVVLCLTPRNRYHEDSSDPAENRTISILGRPPTRRARRITHVMLEELTQAVTLQQDYNRSHKKHILQQRLQ